MPEVASVVWCTGFCSDFSWVQAGAYDVNGYPHHVRGVVSEVPGLDFLGLRFLYRMNSSLLGGDGAAAAYVADHIASRLAPAATSTAGGKQGQLPRALLKEHLKLKMGDDGKMTANQLRPCRKMRPLAQKQSILPARSPYLKSVDPHGSCGFDPRTRHLENTCSAPFFDIWAFR